MPDPRPTFTIVMPCFCAERTIGEAIASVLAQTDADFEMIVIDDGSPDATLAAAHAAIGADGRCRVIRQDNAGPAAARNRGVAMGRGSLLGFLDADDRWMPGLLAAHRQRFDREPGLGVSFGVLRFYDAALRSAGRSSIHYDDVGMGHALAENPCCSTSNLVVRRTTFADAGGFDARLVHAEDQEFIVRVLATTPWRVGGIDRELVHYRTSPGGLSADLAAMERGWREMMTLAGAYADPAAFRSAAPTAHALYARYLARRALRTGHPATTAARHLWAALRTSPVSLLTHEARRTVLTAIGVAAALLLPRRLVQPLLSR